jgi:hypothetical protein
MKKRAVSLTVLICLGFLGAANAMAALGVTTTTNGSVLANTILGPGIVLVGSPTYVGASTQAGTFTGGLSAGIGIDQGIILTSGNANDAPGPNNSDSQTTGTGTGGDPQLSAIVGNSTFDKNILEFDFTTTGGDVFFNYVFASEEYNEYTNTSVNDVFAFFLDGVNIALIPGTSTPVSINTVNGGNPLGVNASNPQFFNNNDLNDGGPFFNLEYDGFTDVFTAQKLNLSAGTHHIKLAISDTGDSAYDSAVFIQANSFSDTPSNIPEPGSWMLLGTIAGITTVALRKRFQRN